MRLLQKQRDDVAIQQNERQQQQQIQIQQEQQRIQQQQILQQQQQIQQQLQFQKQQQEQDKQEQLKQQQIQSQFQQQLKTIQPQQRSTFSNQDLNFQSDNNLLKSIQMTQLPSSPQVSFAKTANLFLKPRLQSSFKQQFSNQF